MNEEELTKARIRCWLVIGLAVGFMIGLGVARFLDVQEFGHRSGWEHVPESLRGERN